MEGSWFFIFYFEALVHEAVNDRIDERVGHAEPVAETKENGHVGPAAEEGKFGLSVYMR
jgi:hypothetical protein